MTASNAATCPDGTTTCYSVTITKKLPLIFSPVFGFAGNTTIGAAAAQLISATAVASYQTSPRNYCVLALASSVATDAIAFLANGGPKADLSGCSIMSNASMTCNGHDLQADYGDAHGTNNGCGNVQTSSMPQVTDPYAARASNIPANSCSSYPQQSGTLPSSNLWSGNKTFGTQTFCGDVKLTGNMTLLGDNVIVIRNGQLNLNGFTLSTGTNADGTAASAVIIFSGDNGSYTHTLTGNGNVNINSPTTGNWAGVALYTDPSLTTGVDMSAAGNSPSWNISGLAYFPHAAITWSGIVGKATSGAPVLRAGHRHDPLQRHRGDARSRRMRSAGSGDAEQPNSHPRQTGGLSNVEDILSQPSGCSTTTRASQPSSSRLPAPR